MEETDIKQQETKKQRGRPRFLTDKERREKARIRAKEYYYKNLNVVRERNRLAKQREYHRTKLMV